MEANPSEPGAGKLWTQLLLLLVVLASFAMADQASASFNLVKPASNGIKQGVDTVEPSAAVANGILIRSDRDIALSHPTAIYSVNAQNWTGSEAFRIEGNVYVSYCIGSDVDRAESPCSELDGTPPIYHNPGGRGYNVHLRATVYRATSTGDVDLSGGLAHTERVCSERRHHCPIHVVDDQVVPHTSGYDRINVQIAAWTESDNHYFGQMLELEANCDNYQACTRANDIPPQSGSSPTKGQLSVVRVGSSYGSGNTVSSTFTPDSFSTHQPIVTGTSGTATVLYSRPVNNLVSGDVLEAKGWTSYDATDACRNGRCPNNPNWIFDSVIQTWWVLADSPSTTVPTNSYDRWLTSRNGQNCTDLNGDTPGICTTLTQAGSVTVPGPSPPQPMHLNYVSEAHGVSGPATPPNTPRALVTGGSFTTSCSRALTTSPACSLP